MTVFRRTTAVAALLLLGALPARAETTALPSTLADSASAMIDPKAPCAGPDYRQLDFWIGDWRVLDGKSGKTVAHDRIRAIHGHCVIREDLRFTGALYRRPGTPFALAGLSINRFDGQQWLQMWADNQWGAILFKGARRADGAFQFDTVIPSRGRDVRLVWHTEPDGLRMEQYGAKAGSGVWERYEDLVYRRERPHR
ncbi:Tetratricopeptide repeat protein [Novosphingobium nitrogenifigens DSM 19370]|uniref:Tetratricopeptide repeat protein n=1 Tax=Novosphingobium nitrogenifigens DSM 19370 TaxID=983920 RepID=F1ZBV8_9SPHN|nr:hypothetical protein [Novosphingobium nitrogenifigens]EGD57966.1 Tetratricopeptide repeat protein [Novosphingobium nitrogenifigens DSM 19370]